MDLGCGNGGLWAMEMARVLGLLVILQNLQMREGETNKVKCERNNKKLIKK